MSSFRAVAAPRRTAGTVRGVVPLPAVMPSSGTRLVSARIICTRLTGTPSSSAAACGSSARAPWPAFDLAGQHGDASVGAEMNARRKVLRAAAKEAVAAALAAFLFLRQCGKRNSDDTVRRPSDFTKARRLSPKS